MKILLVEDDANLAQLLKTSLRAHDRITVVMAFSLVEAMEAIIRLSFDVIVLDLSLPDSAPEPTLGRIKDMKVMNGGGRVIVMTGYDSVELRAHSKVAGADDFISKNDSRFLVGAVMESARRIRPAKPCALMNTLDRLERETMLTLAIARAC